MAPPPATLNRQPSAYHVPLSIPKLNTQRIRSYMFRLPLFTRLMLLAIILLYIASIVQKTVDISSWGSVIPGSIGIFSGGMYRLNTYPLVHVGILHLIGNVICLLPLLERFEAEWGTLTSVALFLGPLSTIPAGLYIGIDHFIFRDNTPVLGASVWVFLLLAVESIKTYRQNPYFQLGPIQIPTWITPLILVFVVSILVPHTSLLGHLCGLLVGYLFGLGYLKFLAPPEKILRWIESKLNLLGRLPHYVSVDQKTYGRYGVLPQTDAGPPRNHSVFLGGSQRLGS